jgi:hypothetical protein
VLKAYKVDKRYLAQKVTFSKIATATYLELAARSQRYAKATLYNAAQFVRVLRTFLLDRLLLALLEPLGGQRSNVFFSLLSPNVFARQRHTATVSAAAAQSVGSF